jgi:hypothetical protein
MIVNNRRNTAIEFLNALQRQVEWKALFVDGIERSQDPLQLIASIAEELGEVSTDLVRGRRYGAVAECIDVAHSALLLAVELDPDALILSRIARPQ